jgi:hypothetical protein
MADTEAAPTKALEGLRAGDLVDEVEVDADDSGSAGLGEDDVVVPDLLDERAGSGGTGGRRRIGHGRRVAEGGWAAGALGPTSKMEPNGASSAHRL